MSLSTKKISVWVVCRNITVRSRLREALNNILVKPNITNFSSAKEVTALPAAEDAPALVIITRSVGSEEIVHIATLLRREDSEAKEVKIIVAIDGRGQLESAAIVELYLANIDGFISEPFSIRDIQMLLTTLFSEEGKAASTDRTHHSAVYVLNDARPHIDQIAEQLALGEEAPLGAKRELERASKTLAKLKKQNIGEYNRAVLDTFINVPPPKKRDLSQGAKIKKKVTKLRHPAHSIKAQMASRNIPLKELARLMRVSEEDLNALLAEQTGITKEIADALARGLGGSPREWFSLQQNYDKQQAELASKKSK